MQMRPVSWRPADMIVLIGKRAPEGTASMHGTALEARAAEIIRAIEYRRTHSLSIYRPLLTTCFGRGYNRPRGGTERRSDDRKTLALRRTRHRGLAGRSCAGGGAAAGLCSSRRTDRRSGAT